MSVFVNGKWYGYLKPTRESGRETHFPLIYLSILGVEGLTRLLKDASASDSIHGIKIAQKISPISHLMFLDNTIIFTKANQKEIHHIYRLLNIYEKESGQKVNLEKSSCIMPTFLTSSQRKA